MLQKYIVLGIIILVVGVSSLPIGISAHISEIHIITVDDEPGDADFTSIEEALNYSLPGDIITVYSGIYREDGIHITTENISLQGISYELGNGTDTGQPFIKPDGTQPVITVAANHVHVSNFRIEKLSYSTCITLGADEPNRYQNNNTITNCSILTPYGNGIAIKGIGKDITIFNNTITGAQSYGISADSLEYTIQHNTLIGIKYNGIKLSYPREKNISSNTIGSCGTGIYLYQGNNNIIYGNDIRSCHTGILNYAGTHNTIQKNNIEDCPIGFSNEGGGSNQIIHNNFQECWYILPWFKTRFLDFVLTKDHWEGNYWEIWRYIAPEPITHPKIIPGLIYFILPIPHSELPFPIPLPWFAVDWHPVQQPYIID